MITRLSILFFVVLLSFSLEAEASKYYCNDSVSLQIRFIKCMHGLIPFSCESSGETHLMFLTMKLIPKLFAGLGNLSAKEDKRQVFGQSFFGRRVLDRKAGGI